MDCQKDNNLQKFYLGYDFVNLPVGARFIKNPPHITQAPPAVIDPQLMSEVGGFVQKIALKTGSIALRSMGTMFVGNRDQPALATRFERTAELEDLHERLVSGLGRIGCDFVNLNYALERYAPHCEAILLDEGERVVMGNITIFSKRPGGQVPGLSEVTFRQEMKG